MILILAALLAATADEPRVGPATIPGETREQKLAYIRDQLRKADSNGDEKISKDEWLAAGGQKAGFERLDTNRDDILTLQELRSNSRKLKAFEDWQAAAPH